AGKHRRRRDAMSSATNLPRQKSLWGMAVLALSLPSVVFVFSHVLLEPRHEAGRVARYGPFLDRVLHGDAGAFTTVGAIVVAAAATWLRSVPARCKLLMWSCVAVSLLALFYLAQVSP